MLQRQRVRDGAVEHFAVMADHDDGVGIFLDIAFEPRRAFQIEIVCRLIQQQHIRLTDQHARNRRAHPPPAGELFRRAVKIIGLEPKSRQNNRGARIGIPRIHIGQALIYLAQLIRVRFGLRRFHQARPFRIGGQDHFHDGLIRRVDFLRNPAEARAFIHADGGIIRRFLNLFADKAQQRGFARAVAPDQADFPAGAK